MICVRWPASNATHIRYDQLNGLRNRYWFWFKVQCTHLDKQQLYVVRVRCSSNSKDQSHIQREALAIICVAFGFMFLFKIHNYFSISIEKDNISMYTMDCVFKINLVFNCLVYLRLVRQNEYCWSVL